MVEKAADNSSGTTPFSGYMVPLCPHQLPAYLCVYCRPVNLAPPAPAGCICPPNSNLTCQASHCPRKPLRPMEVTS